MGDATKVDMDAWDRDLRINLTSMVLTARHAIPHMRKNGRGAIVNMSSVSGLLGGNPSLLYPTTKGAIIQMTRAMAAQHGQENIRVNCVAPGMVFTPMVKSRGVTDEMRQARIAQNLMKQEGDGWDVGYAVLFLCSREAKWITGLIMPVDGGVSAMILTFILRSITDSTRPPQAKQTDQRSRPTTLRQKTQAYPMASYKHVGPAIGTSVDRVLYSKAEKIRRDGMTINSPATSRLSLLLLHGIDCNVHRCAILLTHYRSFYASRLPSFLHVASHLLFLRRVCMLIHGPQRPLKQVIHRFDRPALHLGEAEVDEDYSDIREDGVEEEGSVAHLGNHVGRSACDAIVDNPVDEEAEGHAKRALSHSSASHY